MSASQIEPLLRAAFLAAIPAAAGKTAFENQAFSPVGLDVWYIFTFIPSSPDVATLGSGGSDAISGLVQIDLNIKEGRGLEGVGAFENALRSAFTAGARFVNDSLNVIIKACGRNGPGRPVEGFHRFTVSIDWETRIKRN